MITVVSWLTRRRCLYTLVAAGTLALFLLSAAYAQVTRSTRTEGPAAPASYSQQSEDNTRITEKAFLDENATAMSRMMVDMDIQPTGDVDRDFVAMMVPHHQGAIDMARALLKHGKNEQLRRLAQEIIVTQQEEIAAMRLAVGQPLPPSTPAPAGPTTAPAAQSTRMLHHPD